MASESTPVEQGQDFATSTGTLDQEEMSELSDISNENVAITRSPTDNTMMVGMTEKPATFSIFFRKSEEHFRKLLSFFMGAGGTCDEAETQVEEEDNDGKDDFGSQVSLNSSTQENDAYTDRETGTMDQFGVVRTISKTTNGSGHSGDYVNMTNSEIRTGESRNTGLNNAPVDLEADSEKTSRQRIKARISTTTKLPGIDRVTPPLVTPLVENRASNEEASTNILGSIGGQNEQMSIRMSEPEKAAHVKRESLHEEINRNRQEASRSEKRVEERTDEHLAKNLSRLTREAEQRELRLRDVMEKLRIQQEQTLGTLDTKIDAMMERRTQAIMNRLDGLLCSRIGSKKGESNSGEPSREPRVNFSEQQNRRKTYGSTRGRGSSSGYATGDNRTRGPNIRRSSTGNSRPKTKDRRKIDMRSGDVTPRTGVMRAKEETIPAIRTGGKIQSP